MAQHIWRRCPDCGRLNLVQFGHELACGCRPRSTSAAAAPPTPGPGRPRVIPATPEPRAGITPAENAVALRLLEQAFPDGLGL